MRLFGVWFALAACSYAPPAGTPAATGDGSTTDDAPPIDAPTGVWLTGWSHRKSITIDRTKVSAPDGGLLEFPVVIQLATDPEIAAVARADGADLLFTGADAMTPLAWEIEHYAEGAVTAWVKVPVLDDAADTRLYLYYGNANPPQTNPAMVWTNQFIAVWHLDQDPEPDVTGDIEDSTAGGHDGTAAGSMNDNVIAAGALGPAISFDGSNDLIDIAALDLGNTFTFSAWVNLELGNDLQIKTVFANSNSGLDKPGCRLFVNSDGTADRMVIFETSNGDPVTHRSATTPVDQVPEATWTHLAVVANRTGESAKIFVNGVDRTLSGTIRNDFQISAALELGRMGDEFEWPGGLDEVELASELRSPEWILTAFTNQVAPAEFFEVGSQELEP